MPAGEKHAADTMRKWRIFAGNCMSIVLLYAIAAASMSNYCRAEVLKGQIEEENLRLAQPAAGQPGSGSTNLRISRKEVLPPAASQLPVLDTNAFSQPLKGGLDKNGMRLGLFKPNAFSMPPANKFDIGAERGSKELLLAWERWHHQLSEAIYERWTERADMPGQATLRITVTKDHQIIPTMIESGGRRFDRGLLDAIMSLNGNPGLAFPTLSQREQVTFEADYIAGSDVRPGYTWEKNDVEKIQEDY